MDALHIGYFGNFKSRDTLLLEGDPAALRLLVDLMRRFAAGAPETVDLESLPFVQSHGGVRVSAGCSSVDRIARVAESSAMFSWGRTRAGWEDDADRVSVLRGSVPGHQYLEAAADEVTVQVSCGEYGSDWWCRHG